MDIGAPSWAVMDRRTFLSDGLAAGMAAAIVPAAQTVAGRSPLCGDVIAVMAELRFSPGTGDGAAEAIAALAQATRAEPGCRRYVAARDIERPDHFHLSELWDDLSALADHFATPHMSAFSAKALALGYSAPFLKQLHVARIADLKPRELKSLRTAPTVRPASKG